MPENRIMSASRPQAGLCILRIEIQLEHSLITIRTDRSIGRSIYPARSEPERHFADPDAALQVVADFLHSFGGSPRP